MNTTLVQCINKQVKYSATQTNQLDLKKKHWEEKKLKMILVSKWDIIWKLFWNEYGNKSCKNSVFSKLKPCKAMQLQLYGSCDFVITTFVQTMFVTKIIKKQDMLCPALLGIFSMTKTYLPLPNPNPNLTLA